MMAVPVLGADWFSVSDAHLASQQHVSPLCGFLTKALVECLQEDNLWGKDEASVYM